MLSLASYEHVRRSASLTRVTHRMRSYESESGHILLFKILSLSSRIQKKTLHSP